MLDLHLTGLSKFARFVMKSVLPFILYYNDNYDKNYFRVKILLGKRLDFLRSRIDHSNLCAGIVPTYSRAYAYLVPSSKSVFQTNRNEDPAFDLLRKKSGKFVRQKTSKNSSIIDSYY